MTAAKYVRQGSAVADIGTDHAYLPILLVQNKTASRALASDVVDGPVEKARANVASYRLTEQIEIRKADGLCGIEDFAPDDIIIAGMGGELIARILDESPYVKQSRVNLILQPMTKSEILREYLLTNGFEIVDESLAEEDGRIYKILLSRYDGKVHVATKLQLLIGRPSVDDTPELIVKHCEKIASKLNDRINGLKKSGKTAVSEEAILCELEDYMQSLKN